MDDGDDAGDGSTGADPTANAGTDSGDATGGEPSFAAELDRARDLLDAADLTAFAVGVVRDGREVETRFSYCADAAPDEREGIQSLALLAAHLRVVAEEAGVDHLTAATDAAALAERVEASGTEDADGGEG